MMTVFNAAHAEPAVMFPVGEHSKPIQGQGHWRSTRRIDFSARGAMLAELQGREKLGGSTESDAETASNEALAARLAWPRDMLVAHAAILAERGMPTAHVYAAAAAASIERSILAIAVAEELKGWPAGGMDNFRAGSLADWL